MNTIRGCYFLVFLLTVRGFAAQGLAAPVQCHACRGVVERLDLAQRRVMIHHQEIPGYMAAMTMDFEVRNTQELAAVSPGSEITFDLLVGEREAWIENLHCVGHVTPPPAPAGPFDPAALELKAGDRWPDAELLAEDGRRIRFSDFKGRAVAVNFFFSRCPLPDYCPRLNRNFAAARALLSGPPSNYVFLSVSFDPDFDTPERLAAYAQSYREGSTNQWLFAAAPAPALAHLPRRLGLSLSRLGGGITHNLRTVILDPQGKVYRQFNGQNWTPRELAEALGHAGQPSTPTTSK